MLRLAGLIVAGGCAVWAVLVAAAYWYLRGKPGPAETPTGALHTGRHRRRH